MPGGFVHDDGGHCLTVIPAESEVLFNSEAGQSSTNMTCVALNIKKLGVLRTTYLDWIPACAGMTVR